MSLSAREQRELDSIEYEIAGSAPRLASLLAMFTRLTAGEELPERGQIQGASRRRDSRRPPSLPGMSRPHGRATVRLSLVAALLWLAVSIALAITVLIISRGGNGTGCTVPGAACADQAPAHASRPAETSAASRTRASPGQPNDSGRQQRKEHGLSNVASQPGWGDPVTLLRASVTPVTRVVVGVDGSAASAAALLWAAAETVRYQAGLRIVSVWAETAQTGTCRAGHPAQAAAQLVDKALARVLSLQHYPRRIACATLRGTPGEALLSQARDTDLLVLGATSAHAAHLPGSIGRYYLLHGCGPLALVPALA